MEHINNPPPLSQRDVHESAGSNPRQVIVDPMAEPLSGPYGRAAVNGQLFQYPKILRTENDPAVPGQKFVLVAFHLFDTPQEINVKGGRKKVPGFFKIRGTYPEEDEAKRRGAALVREIDSTFHTGIAPVGVWQPITENPHEFAAEVITAMDEKHMEKQREIDSMRRKRIKEADDSKKNAEFAKRKEEMATNDPQNNPDSIEFTCAQNTVWLKLYRERDELKAKMKSITNKLKSQHEIKEYLQRRHPEYYVKDAWLERVNKDRAANNIVSEVLLPDERVAFEKRLETTRAPKNIIRTPKKIMVDLNGPDNDDDNFILIYPEYEEDYRLDPDDNDEDKLMKGHNLNRYRKNVTLAEKGDRMAMAAVCPWKLDARGNYLDGEFVPPARLEPGTEDNKNEFPETENLPLALPPKYEFDPKKGSRQEVFTGLHRKPPPAQWRDYGVEDRDADLKDTSANPFGTIGDFADSLVAAAISPLEETLTSENALVKIRVWLKSGKTNLLKSRLPTFFDYPADYGVEIGHKPANIVKTFDRTRIYEITGMKLDDPKEKKERRKKKLIENDRLEKEEREEKEKAKKEGKKEESFAGTDEPQSMRK
jgi:hypothetical protein